MVVDSMDVGISRIRATALDSTERMRVLNGVCLPTSAYLHDRASALGLPQHPEGGPDFRHLALSVEQTCTELALALDALAADVEVALFGARDGGLRANGFRTTIWDLLVKHDDPPWRSFSAERPRPNEYWHIDVTIIRLLDGTRLYLHAVIDNFSRRILAWKLAARLEPQTTCAVLSTAGAGLDLTTNPATVVADSGVENVNGEVDAFMGLGHLRRVLAQVEVTFSNSMIEAWWRSLKHNWLFLNKLDTHAAVERLVAFYVEQHNAVMPHAAFQGQTPDETYFGTGAEIPAKLAAAHRAAIAARAGVNRALHCGSCQPAPPVPAVPVAVNPPVLSNVLQMHAPNSRMP